MITFFMWFTLILDRIVEESLILMIFIAILLSIFTIPLDIILMPLEIISLIIYKIIERKDKNGNKWNEQ